MIPEKAKTIFPNSRWQLAPDAHELGESHFLRQTCISGTGHEDNAYKVSNTSLMFNMDEGGDKMLWMGSTATHQNLHITRLPPLCEQCDSTGQTKRCNGVCSRNQPRVIQYYEYHWFYLI